MVEAILLAGRRNQHALKAVASAEWEAMVPVAGRPMAAWVLDALRRSGRVSRVIAVGPEDLRPLLAAADLLVEPGSELLENVRRGLRPATPGAQLLIATSDIPMLTADAVRDFLDGSAPHEGADVCYPVIAREDVERRFAGNRRTYVRLRDGTFTGGNLFLLRQERCDDLMRIAEQVIALRKKPLRLAALIGIGFVVRMLLGRATVAEAQRQVEKTLQVRGRAVRTRYAEIGVDVDHPEDVTYCERELGNAMN